MTTNQSRLLDITARDQDEFYKINEWNKFTADPDHTEDDPLPNYFPAKAFQETYKLAHFKATAILGDTPISFDNPEHRHILAVALITVRKEDIAEEYLPLAEEMTKAARTKNDELKRGKVLLLNAIDSIADAVDSIADAVLNPRETAKNAFVYIINQDDYITKALALEPPSPLESNSSPQTSSFSVSDLKPLVSLLADVVTTYAFMRTGHELDNRQAEECRKKIEKGVEEQSSKLQLQYEEIEYFHNNRNDILDTLKELVNPNRKLTLEERAENSQKLANAIKLCCETIEAKKAQGERLKANYEKSEVVKSLLTKKYEQDRKAALKACKRAQLFNKFVHVLSFFGCADLKEISFLKKPLQALDASGFMLAIKGIGIGLSFLSNRDLDRKRRKLQKIDARYQARMAAWCQTAGVTLSLAEAAYQDQFSLIEQRRAAMLEHALNPGKYEYGSEYQKKLEESKQEVEKDLSKFESQQSALNNKISQEQAALDQEQEEIARLENKQQAKYKKTIDKLIKDRDELQQKLNNTNNPKKQKEYQKEIKKLNEDIQYWEELAAKRYAGRLFDHRTKAENHENVLIVQTNQQQALSDAIETSNGTKSAIEAAAVDYEKFIKIHEMIASIELPSPPTENGKKIIEHLADLQQTLQQAHHPRNEFMGAFGGLVNSLDPLVMHYCPITSLTDDSKVVSLSTYFNFVKTALHLKDSLELIYYTWEFLGVHAAELKTSRFSAFLEMGGEAQVAAGWVPFLQTCTQATTLIELGLIIIRGGAPSPVMSLLQKINENMEKEFTHVNSKLEDLHADLRQNTELTKKTLDLVYKVQENLNDSRQLITKQLCELKGEILRSTSILIKGIKEANDANLTHLILEEQKKFDSDRRLNLYRNLFINGEEQPVSKVELVNFLSFTLEATRHLYTDLTNGGLHERGVSEKTILREPYLYTGLIGRLVGMKGVPNLYLLTSTSHIVITLMQKLLTSRLSETSSSLCNTKELIEKVLMGLISAHRKFKELDSPASFAAFYVHALESSKKLKEAARIQFDSLKERIQESNEVRETWEQYLLSEESQKDVKSHISYLAFMLREESLPDFITEKRTQTIVDSFNENKVIVFSSFGAGALACIAAPPLGIGFGVAVGVLAYLENWDGKRRDRKSSDKTAILGQSLQAIVKAFPKGEGIPAFKPNRRFIYVRYFVHYYISNKTQRWESEMKFNIPSGCKTSIEEDWMDFTSNNSHVFSFTAKLDLRDKKFPLRLKNLPEFTPLNELDKAFTNKFNSLKQDYGAFISCQLSRKKLSKDNLFHQLVGNSRLVPGVAENAIPLAFPKGLVEAFEHEILSEYYRLNRKLSVQYELKPCGRFYRIQLLFSFKDSIDKGRDYFREVPLGHIDNTTVHAFNRLKFDGVRDKYEHLPFDPNEVLLLLFYQKFSQIGLPGAGSRALTAQIVIPSLAEVSSDFYHLWNENYAYFSYNSATATFSNAQQVPFVFGKDMPRIYEEMEKSKKDFLASDAFIEYLNRLDLLNAYCELVSEEKVRSEMIDLPGLIDPEDPFLNRKAIGLAQTIPEQFYLRLKKAPSQALRRAERQLKSLEKIQQSLQSLKRNSLISVENKESMGVGKISKKEYFSLRKVEQMVV